MAGGMGLRLHPLTISTPKPLLKVGSKPIIETIIDRCASHGFKDFTICVNYKAELIEGYFGNGSSRGLDIKYIHESKPLGTAGALRSFFPMNQPFIVHNADVLADVDYNDLMKKHFDHGLDATACLGLHLHQIPYGVAVMDGDRVTEIREKPIESFSVSAGIYVLPPDAPRKIADGHCDMPDLLNKMSVGAYPIEGFWCDVGHFESLAVASINWSLRMAS